MVMPWSLLSLLDSYFLTAKFTGRQDRGATKTRREVRECLLTNFTSLQSGR